MYIYIYIYMCVYVCVGVCVCQLSGRCTCPITAIHSYLLICLDLGVCFFYCWGCFFGSMLCECVCVYSPVFSVCPLAPVRFSYINVYISNIYMSYSQYLSSNSRFPFLSALSQRVFLFCLCIDSLCSLDTLPNLFVFVFPFSFLLLANQQLQLRFNFADQFA